MKWQWPFVTRKTLEQTEDACRQSLDTVRRAIALLESLQKDNEQLRAAKSLETKILDDLLMKPTLNKWVN